MKYFRSKIIISSEVQKGSEWVSTPKRNQSNKRG